MSLIWYLIFTMQLFNQWLNKYKEINILEISTKTLIVSFHDNTYLRKLHLNILSYAIVLYVASTTCM